MLFGLDGIEIGLIIVFLTLFGAILSGFPVAFAISGAAVISFAIIAALDSSGYQPQLAPDAQRLAVFGFGHDDGVAVATQPLHRLERHGRPATVPRQRRLVDVDRHQVIIAAGP